MATVDQLEKEAEKKALTPKPDPFEPDARREIKKYEKETGKERETRQKKNRQESPDIQHEPSAVIYPKGKIGTMRDKLLASGIGHRVRFDLQRGPCVTGRLLQLDMQMGQAMIQGPQNSPPSLLFIQLKHIIRLEIFPD